MRLAYMGYIHSLQTTLPKSLHRQTVIAIHELKHKACRSKVKSEAELVVIIGKLLRTQSLVIKGLIVKCLK